MDRGDYGFELVDFVDIVIDNIPSQYIKLTFIKKGSNIKRRGAEAHSESTIMVMPQNLDSIITFEVALTPGFVVLGNRPLPPQT